MFAIASWLGGHAAEAVPQLEGDGYNTMGSEIELMTDAGPHSQTSSLPGANMQFYGSKLAGIYKSNGTRVLGGILVLGLAATFIGNTITTSAKEEAPTMENFVPWITEQAIRKNASSPQALALNYVRNHQDYEIMPYWRKQQLLALSTFWFGLNPRPKNHMIAWPNECEWWELHPSCNDKGQYQRLESDWATFGTAHGTLPPELSLLTELKDLHLSNHSLIGTLPSEIAKLTDLTGIHLFENDLSGTIPTELGKLTALTALQLDHNHFSGSLPQEIGMISTLIYLHVEGNELTGSLPSELGELTSMVGFQLGSNHLTGSIPSEIGLPTSTEYLHVHNNSLTGAIPSELGKLSNMKDLSLQNNDISGMVPSALGQLKHLTSCNMNGTGIAGHHSSPLACIM